MTFPLQYLGEGQFQAPRGFTRRADRELVIGETLQWEIVKLRSMKSHAHYFALIAEAWRNLPEALVEEYPNPEVLRKRALIRAGYCTVSHVIARDPTEAIKTAYLMTGMDAYAVVKCVDCVVEIWRAESQRVKAMGPKRFQESKDAVLTQISQMIGADIMQASEAA